MSFFNRKKNEPRRLCALHIDDSRWVRIPVSVILRRTFGMRVLEASGGEEGLIVAEREQPDIIILDIMMPHMDGFDTLARLKQNERTKEIPVVMCTARNLAREVNTAMQLGAVGFLIKPIEEEALVEKTKDILASMGKWGDVVEIGRKNYHFPPDEKMDFMIPKEQPEAPSPTPNAPLPVPSNTVPPTNSPCTICRGPLHFVPLYNAWYCYVCRKYPELEA